MKWHYDMNIRNAISLPDILVKLFFMSVKLAVALNWKQKSGGAMTVD